LSAELGSPPTGTRLALSSAEVNMSVGEKRSALRNPIADEEGAIGYIAAWLLGIPASVLFVIFLLRGCN
jgi:hypothetical protein